MWCSLFKGEIFIIAPPCRLRVSSVRLQGWGLSKSILGSVISSSVIDAWLTKFLPLAVLTPTAASVCFLYPENILERVLFSNCGPIARKCSSLTTRAGTWDVYNDHMEGLLWSLMFVLKSGLWGEVRGHPTGSFGLKVTGHWSLWVKSHIFTFACVLVWCYY